MKHSMAVSVARTGLFRACRLLVSLLLVMSLAGCAAMDSVFNFVGLGGSAGPDTAESLAMQGLDEYNYGKYSSALKTFEDLRDRYPFSQYSLLAELKIADCRYYDKEYVEAAVLYEEFENNHPTNEAIPYVMFQVGMCHYRQIDTIDRDPAGAYDSIQAFSRLIRTYPESPYTIEARSKVLEAQNFLALHEFYVADFYVRTKEYKQAEHRLEFLLNNYPVATVASQAKELLAAVQSDNPPKRSWRSWLPEFSMPDWKTFSSGLGFGVGGATPPE